MARIPARLESHPNVRAVRDKPASAAARVIDAENVSMWQSLSFKPNSRNGESR